MMFSFVGALDQPERFGVSCRGRLVPFSQLSPFSVIKPTAV
jgi:hypothetical protein